MTFTYVSLSLKKAKRHKKRDQPKLISYPLAWQLPILAGSFPPTTFGAEKLNFCVRHGNRCILLTIVTTLYDLVPSKLDIKT